MKSSLLLVTCLLPYVISVVHYDESSTKKIKLEDIEEDRVKNENQSESLRPPSIPPPLSKQPAKGQPSKVYPPPSEDPYKDYHSPKPSTSNHYSTRAQSVQPLTDQPSAPEADYQQSPAFQSETIVYFPNNGHGQSQHLQGNSLQQHLDDEQQQQLPQQQQPSAVYYYNHHSQQQAQQHQQNAFQIQFVPIEKHGGSDEQQTYSDGREETVPSTNTGENQILTPTAIISYSHDFGDQSQQQDGYDGNTDVNNLQHVYGLPANVFYQSQKDIEYAQPANTYGPPHQENSEQGSSSSYQQAPDYQKDIKSQGSLTSYGPPIYVNQQNDLATVNKPAITYGPPDTVGQSPKIEYGVPEAPFRRPEYQSNQASYAPRRPEPAARSNQKPFVTFPYPPSFISITTERPSNEVPTPTPETSYNEITKWHTNVMPINLIPPQQTHYRSYGGSQDHVPTPSPYINQNIDSQLVPLIDLFHSRRAKSLLDSYIPSWLVAKMQEEHARQLQQQQNKQHGNHYQQNFVVPTSLEAGSGYNTIAYSSPFENIYGNSYKRSIQKSKRQPKKKLVTPSSTEEITAMT